jgi:hypothetical protein
VSPSRAIARRGREPPAVDRNLAGIDRAELAADLDAKIRIADVDVADLEMDLREIALDVRRRLERLR